MARNQYNASSSAPLGCTHRPYMPCSPCDLLEASINAIHIETCHWEQFKGHGATFILLRPIFLSGKYSIYKILMERLAILALAYCFKDPECTSKFLIIPAIERQEYREIFLQWSRSLDRLKTNFLSDQHSPKHPLLLHKTLYLGHITRAIYIHWLFPISWGQVLLKSTSVAPSIVLVRHIYLKKWEK